MARTNRAPVMNDVNWVPTETTIDCEFCSWPNETVIEDNTITYRWRYEFECESCQRTNIDDGTAEERGMSQVLFTITICCVAAAVFLFMGGKWLPAIGALAVLTIIHGVAKGDTKRNEKP